MKKYDRGWAYKQNSIKPSLVCPYCGNMGYIYAGKIESESYTLCVCEECNSEWFESEKYWNSALVNGYIEEA